MIKLLSFLILGASTAWAGPYGFTSGSYLGYLEGTYLKTNQNYDVNGNSVNLPAANQFTQYGANAQVAYDFSNRFGIYSNLMMKYVDTTTYPYELTNNGVTDFGFGMGVLLWGGFVNVIPDVSFSVPLCPLPGNTVLLGDCVYTGTGKLYISKTIHHLSLAGYGGYTYRSQNLSASVPFGLLSTFTWRSFFIDIRGMADVSLDTDYYPSNSLARQQFTGTYDGGSLIYDAINPSLFTVSVRLGWRPMRKLFVVAGIEQTLAGQRSAQYTGFIVGLGLTDIWHHSAADSDDFEPDTKGEETPENTDTPPEPAGLQKPRSESIPIR